MSINGTTVNNGDSYLYDSTNNSNVVVAVPAGDASYCSTININGGAGVQTYDESDVAYATIAFKNGDMLNVTFEMREVSVNPVISAIAEKVKEVLKEAIQKEIGEEDYAKLVAEVKRAIGVMENLIEKLMDEETVEAVLNALAEELKAEVKVWVEEAMAYIVENYPVEEIQARVEALLAKIKAIKEELGGVTEEEIRIMIEEALVKVTDKVKAEVKAAMEAAMDAEGYAYIAEKAEQLQAAIDELLSGVHLCEHTAEVVLAEVDELIAAFVADAEAYIEAKADEIMSDPEAKLEEIKDAVEAVMGWRPDFDLTEAGLKEILAGAAVVAKDQIKAIAKEAKLVLEDILEETYEEIPAVEPTCDYGWTAGRVCVCEEIIIAPEKIDPIYDHEYEAGEDEEGNFAYVCKGCGAIADRMLGDVNEDGKVWIEDLQLVAMKLAGGYEIKVFNEINADVNEDGKVYLEDLIGIAIMLANM